MYNAYTCTHAFVSEVFTISMQVSFYYSCTVTVLSIYELVTQREVKFWTYTHIDTQDEKKRLELERRHSLFAERTHYYGNRSNSKTAQAADRLFLCKRDSVLSVQYSVYVCVFLMAAVVVRTHTHIYTSSMFRGSRSARVLRGRRVFSCVLPATCAVAVTIEPGYIHGNYSMIPYIPPATSTLSFVVHLLSPVLSCFYNTTHTHFNQLVVFPHPSGLYSFHSTLSLSLSL